MLLFENEYIFVMLAMNFCIIYIYHIVCECLYYLYLKKIQCSVVCAEEWGIESRASIQIALVEFSSGAQMFSFSHDAWFTFATWWKVFTIQNKMHWNLLIVTNDIEVWAEKLAHETHTG